MGGIWAGPVGVAVGVVLGGVLGALLADHVYVETAGSEDPVTRAFLARFTGLWTGVDEAGMARALAREHRQNLPFVRRVFLGLNADYQTDADDVALELVSLMQRDPGLATAVRGHAALRDTLVQVLDDGWTSDEEQAAIRFLQAR
jgi:hypothetical protein